MVKVKTGVQNNTHIEIISGLSEGQEVISGPYGLVSRLLKEGMKVKKTATEELFENNKK